MPLRLLVETDTIEFKDEKGQPVGASFTITRELSYQGYREYLDLCMEFRLNETELTRTVENGNGKANGKAKGKADDRQSILAETKRITLTGIQDVLVKYGLVRFQGVLDEEGQDLPVERWADLPPHYARQVFSAIQVRNKTEDELPNSGAPSKRSSGRKARKQSGTPITNQPPIT